MKAFRLTILTSTLLLLAACGGDDDVVVIPKDSSPNIDNGKSANINKNTTGPVEAQTCYEFPKLKDDNTIVIVHKGELNTQKHEKVINYSVEWDYGIRSQRWTCYQMYKDNCGEKEKSVSRYYVNNGETLTATSQYPNDPDLPEAYRFTADPYRSSGYDHGHICPSADRIKSSECNYQTFFMTNMQPQHMNFNGSNRDASINQRSPWYRLESLVRTWAQTSDTLYVCKGGVISANESEIKYIGSGNNKIPVPKYFFVALFSKKGTNYKAAGFWMEHVSSYDFAKSMSVYTVNIDQLEKLAEMDFFCNLPDDVEEKVESAPKAQIIKDWGID